MNRGDENYNLMVKLKPGVSVRQAQADLDIIATRIREKDKRDRTFGMTVVGLLDQVVGDVRRPLLVLLGSVALVLLIACANVANLLLTRAAGRKRSRHSRRSRSGLGTPGAPVVDRKRAACAVGRPRGNRPRRVRHSRDSRHSSRQYSTAG